MRRSIVYKKNIFNSQINHTLHIRYSDNIFFVLKINSYLSFFLLTVAQITESPRKRTVSAFFFTEVKSLEESVKLMQNFLTNFARDLNNTQKDELKARLGNHDFSLS